MEAVISLPGHITPLIEEMKKHDFLVHSFPLSDGQSIYSPHNYLYNKTVENREYLLIIDTNIFHFLLRSTEGVANEKTRTAAGLVAFCQAAEIDIDPAMAVYEQINYDESRAQEAVDKLLLFEKVNNADNQELTEFCLGERDTFNLPETPERDADELKSDLTRYRRLIEWDSVYLVVLLIVHTDQSASQNRNKVQSIMKWMYEKFHLSIAGLAYSALYFGKHPLKNMMKYKPTDSVDVRRKDLMNMTWDLFIITQYFRKWVGNTSNKEFIYASDDRAFREILRLGIDVQITKDMSPFSEFLNDDVYRQISEMYASGVADEDREYYLAEDPGVYRAELIAEIESQLGIRITTTPTMK